MERSPTGLFDTVEGQRLAQDRTDNHWRRWEIGRAHV